MDFHHSSVWSFSLQFSYRFFRCFSMTFPQFFRGCDFIVVMNIRVCGWRSRAERGEKKKAENVGKTGGLGSWYVFVCLCTRSLCSAFGKVFGRLLVVFWYVFACFLVLFSLGRSGHLLFVFSQQC